MAKYTELFSEYLENGGDLPAVFSEIEGFGDLFKGYYCDKEIGFETPALFAIKLENRANDIVPAYAERITRINEFKAKFEQSEKTTVKSGNINRDYGERTNYNWDNPFNVGAAAATENNVTTQSKTAAYTDKESYENVNDTQSGYTPDEAERRMRYYEGEITNLKHDLLLEFNNLFMRIY